MKNENATKKQFAITQGQPVDPEVEAALKALEEHGDGD
jgi:hypothetical protein